MWVNVIYAKLNLRQCCQQWFAAARRGGFTFMGFVAGAFVLHSSYVSVCCLPSLLAIVECLFAPTTTLSCLHHVTLVSTWIGKYFQWLPLSGLPWISARLACITLGSTWPYAPSPSSSIGDEFNLANENIG